MLRDLASVELAYIWFIGDLTTYNRLFPAVRIVIIGDMIEQGIQGVPLSVSQRKIIFTHQIPINPIYRIIVFCKKGRPVAFQTFLIIS